MEGEQRETGAGEDSGGGGGGGGDGVLRKPTPSRPHPTSMPARADGGVGPSPAAFKPLQSPMSAMVSGFLVDHQQDGEVENRSFSHLLAGAMGSPSPSGDNSVEGSGEEKAVVPTESPAAAAAGRGASSHGVENHRGGEGEGVNRGSPGASGGSFAERLAARGAANNKATTTGGSGGPPRPPISGRLKSIPPSRLPIPRQSPYVTIPPGFSPNTLLDSSPVLLSTSQSEPSPTTGTFPMPPLFNAGVPRPGAPAGDGGKERSGDQPFVFKPFVKTAPRPPLSPLAPLPTFGMSHHQAQALSQVHQAHAQQQAVTSSAAPSAPARPPAPSTAVPVAVPVSFVVAQPLQVRAPSQSQQTGGESEQNSQGSQGSEQPAPPATVTAFPERPSEDGYNWRKYGQKQVKGSEYPRSYYKCTQASCPMKKKVERSHDGQVTEIVYKGEHNHPKPQPTRRLTLSGAHHISDNSGASGTGLLSMVKNEGGNAERDGSERQNAQPVQMGASGATEHSSPSTSDDEGEEGSKQSTEDGDEDEPDSKRRKKDKKVKETVPAPRMVREPRVVVQTTSDVDILDDGYRWRKYGQKVVKGNNNPRSYYKCTNVGCPVRKHVERASNDYKAVITTYEGKHNHDVPAARNSGHEAAMQAAVPVTTTATSLQDQGVRFGSRSFGEDSASEGMKAGGDIELGMGVGMGPRIQGAREQGLNRDSAPTAIAISLSASFNDVRPPVQTREPFSNFGSMLKQEQPESTAQTALVSSNTSFHQNMAPV